MKRARVAGLCAAVGLVAVVAALIAALAVGATTVSADRDGEAAIFAARAIRLLADNRYAAAWPTLHPAHQQAAPRAEYVRCESISPIPGRVQSISVRSVRDERTSIPPLGRPMTKAVAVRLVIVDESVPEGVVVKHVVHVIRVAGRWRWVLPALRYAAYRGGRCDGEQPRASGRASDRPGLGRDRPVTSP